MIRADLDVVALVRRGQRQGMRLQEIDLGYLVHSAADATFGAGALRPFSITERERWARVLAYTERAPDVLQDHAQAFAEPSDHGAWDWDSFASKPMLARFDAGRRLGFSLRVCPVVRSLGRDGMHQAGKEIDAFLAACARAGQGVPVDREAVYLDWLSRRLEGAARLEDASVETFRRVRLLRRTQGGDRRSCMLERPSATFRGVLEVQDTARFAGLLRKGVGRHKAFGFGMLLLSPP